MAIVEEEINDGSESSNYAAKIKANIICPICQKKTKVYKLKYGTKGKMRWVISNFERHFKCHYNADNLRGTQIHSNHPTGKAKQVRLENFFLQSSPENQLADNELMNEFQEEYPNGQDRNDISDKRTKCSAMDSVKYGILEGITKTTNTGE